MAKRSEYLESRFCFKAENLEQEIVVDLVQDGLDRVQQLGSSVQMRLVLLDSIDAFRNVRSRIFDALDRGWLKDVLYVGDLGLRPHELFDGRPCSLLYDQLSNYHREGNLMFQLRARLLTIRRGQHHLYRLGLTSLAKDLATHPVECLRLALGPGTVVFAGRSGMCGIMHTVASLGCDSQCRDKFFNELQRDLARLDRAPFEETCREFARLLQKAYRFAEQISHDELSFKARKCILFKSLFRLFCLSLLSRYIKLVVLGYPEYYLRVYESRVYRRHTFLDFGGINGFESIYPRTADLSSNGAKWLQVDQELMRAAFNSTSPDDWANCLKSQTKQTLTLLSA